MTAVSSSALHRKEIVSPEKISASNTRPQHSSSRSRYRFELLEPSSPHFFQIEKMFRTQLEPLYGNQDEALRKIKEGRDRICEMLLYKDGPIGFIVYKKANQQECHQEGLPDSFEIKSLVATEFCKGSREDCRKRLLERVKKLAANNLARSIHLTVSEKSPETLTFLKERGFSIKTTWQDKYMRGFKEYLLYSQTKNINKKRKRSFSLEKREDEISVDESRKLKRTKHEVKERKGQDQGNDSSSSKVNDRTSAGPSKRKTEIRSERSRLDATPRKMNTHAITLRKKYIHQIRSGGKTVEGRINSGMILKFRTGDRIRFFCGQHPSDEVVCQIKDIRKYNSFREMLEQEGYEKCLTDVKSLDEAVTVYDKIPGYAHRAAQHGVVAIHLQQLKR